MNEGLAQSLAAGISELGLLLDEAAQKESA
jgi:hypothetical protein